jgi:hypothetical protein
VIGSMRAGMVPLEAGATAALLVPALQVTASRLPPFGREVVRALAAARYVNVYIYAGPDAWARVRARRASHGAGSAMLLPMNAAPAMFKWPIVSNGVLIVATDRRGAFDLARAVVSCGTPMAFAAFGDNALIISRTSGVQTSVRAA